MNFPQTNWSLLRIATLNGDSNGRAALATLCDQYRQPVVTFLHHRGCSEEDAEDLVQELFLELLDNQSWRRADQAKGRFRTFLLGVLMFVLSRRRRRSQTMKRGAGETPQSLDELAEAGFEVADESEAIQFDRHWALRLVNQALNAVEEEFHTSGRAAEWTVLVHFLPGSGQQPAYETAAAELNLTNAALKSSISRLRQKFREELRHLVSHTVSAPHEIDEELCYLRDVLTKIL